MQSSISIEETRVRGVTGLLSKLLLQYLTELITLPDFHKSLWLQILHFIELYMQADQSGVLVSTTRVNSKYGLLVGGVNRYELLAGRSYS